MTDDIMKFMFPDTHSITYSTYGQGIHGTKASKDHCNWGQKDWSLHEMTRTKKKNNSVQYNKEKKKLFKKFRTVNKYLLYQQKRLAIYTVLSLRETSVKSAAQMAYSRLRSYIGSFLSLLGVAPTPFLGGVVSLLGTSVHVPWSAQ